MISEAILRSFELNITHFSPHFLRFERPCSGAPCAVPGTAASSCTDSASETRAQWGVEDEGGAGMKTGRLFPNSDPTNLAWCPENFYRPQAVCEPLPSGHLPPEARTSGPSLRRSTADCPKDPFNAFKDPGPVSKKDPPKKGSRQAPFAVHVVLCSFLCNTVAFRGKGGNVPQAAPLGFHARGVCLRVFLSSAVFWFCRFDLNEPSHLRPIPRLWRDKC